MALYDVPDAPQIIPTSHGGSLGGRKPAGRPKKNPSDLTPAQARMIAFKREFPDLGLRECAQRAGIRWATVKFWKDGSGRKQLDSLNFMGQWDALTRKAEGAPPD